MYFCPAKNGKVLVVIVRAVLIYKCSTINKGLMFCIFFAPAFRKNFGRYFRIDFEIC